jgi:putative transposase
VAVSGDEQGNAMSETLFKTFEYWLYPSTAQRKRMEATLETCRRWYNQCQAERRDAYCERGKRIGKYDQVRQVKMLKATNPYAKDIHTHVLQVVCDDFDKAFQAFFRCIKAGEKEGYPPYSFIPSEGLCRISPK